MMEQSQGLKLGPAGWLGIAIIVGCVPAASMASERATNVVCDGCVGTPDLGDSAVTAPKLRDQAVTTSKLRNKAVNRAKLKNNTVNSAKIQDGTVSNADLANFSVSESKIQVGAVNGGHIQVDAITRSHIDDGTIHDSDIQDEPGVEFVDLSSGLRLDRTLSKQTVRSLQVTVPAPGFVTCMHSSNLTYNTADTDGETYVWWEVDNLNNNNRPWHDQIPNGAADDIMIAGHRTFVVNSTNVTHEFKLQARTLVADPNEPFITNFHATCMYFPTRY